MLKLRIINKPKMYKLKCNFAFPNIILANMQEKEVTPTKEIQEVVPDIQYDGLSKVTINPIPDEYIIPKLGSKQITENGIYKASDDNLDGYSSVDVNVGGIKITNAYYLFYNGVRLNSINELIGALSPDTTYFYGMFYGCGLLTSIPQFNTSKGTNFNSMLWGCRSLTTIPQLDTSEGTDFSYMFYGCSSLKIIPLLNISKGIDMSNMFNNCVSLMTVPQLDASKGTSVSSMFSYCRSLTNFG